MFPSISRATPNSLVSTSFTNQKTQRLIFDPSEMTVRVIRNGQLLTSVPVIILAPTGYRQNRFGVADIIPNDIVTATITSPIDYLNYRFYTYSLNANPPYSGGSEVSQSFAVINKSYYQATVKTPDNQKRWYLYAPTEHTASIMFSGGTKTPLVFQTTQGSITANVHPVIDPLTNAVYFFSKQAIVEDFVVFDSAPIDCIYISSLNVFVVATTNGKLFKINQAGNSELITTLTATTNNNFYTNVRNPVTTTLCQQGNILFVGGNGKIWRLDLSNNFNLLSTVDIAQYVYDLVPTGAGNYQVLAVTQTNRVYGIKSNNDADLLLTGVALGKPSLFNGLIYLPDGEQETLKIYDPAQDSWLTDISLIEFSPKHTLVADGKLYITANDSNKVLILDSTLTQSWLSFDSKVTRVTVTDGTVVASHYLKDFVILDARDLYRIIDVKFDPRTGPVSHIGTNTVQIKTLGNDEVTARTPRGTFLWVNGARTDSSGVRGTLLYNNDYISLNFYATSKGERRTNCIIGDTAYDYDVTAEDQTYYPRNIDFPISDTGIENIHTRSFTLSSRTEPCLISLEYGDLFVNGALYLGQFPVAPNDLITLSIRTGKPKQPSITVIPILTIGSRQFAIPISANPGNLTPQVIFVGNLSQTQSVQQQITVSGTASLYDFTLPYYSDVDIFKNNVPITGNYLQSFGKNDVLAVRFTSSSRRYDQFEVYILGPTNYKFVGQNLQPTVLNYLNFGNVFTPYTRNFEQTVGSQISTNQLTYEILPINYPEVQVTSNSLTITGNGSLVSNISLVGLDTVLYVNGNLVANVYSNVSIGDTVVVGRNVESYFDANITVLQHILDPDYDVYVDIVIGFWGIVNQKIGIGDRITTNDFEILAPDLEYYELVGQIADRNTNVEINRPLESSKYFQGELELGELTSSTTGLIGILDQIVIYDKSGFIIEHAVGQSQAIKENSFALMGPENYSNRLTGQFDQDELIIDKGSSMEFLREDQAKASSPLYELLRYNTKEILINDELDRENIYTQLEVDIVLDNKDINFILLNNQPADLDNKDHLTITGITLPENEKINEKQFLPYTPVIQIQNLFNSTLDSEFSQDHYIDVMPYKFDAYIETEHTMSRFLEKKYDLNYASTKIYTWDVEQSIDLISDPFNIDSDVLNYYAVYNGQISIDKDTIPRFESSTPDVLTNTYQAPNQSLQLEKSIQNFTDGENLIPVPDTNNFINLETSWSITEIIDYLSTQSNLEIEIDNYSNLIFDGVLEHEISKVEKYFLPKQDIFVDKTKFYYPLEIVDNGTVNHIQFIPSNDTNKNYNYQIIKTTIDSPEFYSNVTVYRHADSSIEILEKTVNEQMQLEFNLHRLVNLEVRENNFVFTPINPVQDLSTLYQTPSATVSDDTKFNYIKLYVNYVTGEIEYRFVNAYSMAETHQAFIFDRINYYKAQDNEHIATGVDQSKETVNYPYTPKYLGEEANPFNFFSSKTLVIRTIPEPLNLAQTNLTTETADITNTVSIKRGVDSPALTNTVSIKRGVDSPARTNLVQTIPTDTQRDQLNVGILFYGVDPNRPDVPQARNLPSFDNGIVWENILDVHGLYGSFTTELDAIAAATANNYTSYRPYQLPGEDLWTYRVIVNTNLVCPLPRGRYAVAWLIRGG